MEPQPNLPPLEAPATCAPSPGRALELQPLPSSPAVPLLWAQPSSLSLLLRQCHRAMKTQLLGGWVLPAQGLSQHSPAPTGAPGLHHDLHPLSAQRGSREGGDLLMGPCVQQRTHKTVQRARSYREVTGTRSGGIWGLGGSSPGTGSWWLDGCTAVEARRSWQLLVLWRQDGGALGVQGGWRE